MRFADQDASLQECGFQLHRRAAVTDLHRLEQIAEGLDDDRAGLRLRGIPKLRELIHPDSAIGRVACGHLGPGARSVRAILFDKSAERNWSLAWHQDRTIAVTRRVHVEGFGPWTVKRGMIHVAPPFDLLVRMVTIRVHLDAVDAMNAPLLVSPGSHLALVPEGAINETVANCGAIACLAEPGDVWAYCTPILHASDRASHPRRRRVLQIDYAAEELPGGLAWLGV